MKAMRGFTIVELLIVIVVIAILAAVSVIAYGGIQQRANNTVTINAASQWVRVLTIMYNNHGQLNADLYSLPDGADGICLGNPDDYPETNHLPAGSCYEDMYAYPDLYEAMASDIEVHMQTPEVETDNGKYSRGVQYSFDGPAYLWYDLSGTDQDCTVSGSESSGNGPNATYCRVNMNEKFGEAPIDF